MKVETLKMEFDTTIRIRLAVEDPMEFVREVYGYYVSSHGEAEEYSYDADGGIVTMTFPASHLVHLYKLIQAYENES